jgi:hypothetical protein
MIRDEVVYARVPRLGTITTGYGQERQAKSGATVPLPRRSDTLVVHTQDATLAEAAQATYGGKVVTDSPSWSFDVVTDVRELHATMVRVLFRQALELWKRGECARRCDGVETSTIDGRPNVRPCVCSAEMARGADRACKPHTVMPVLLDLPAERFGVWEVRTSGWRSASALKGTLAVVKMLGDPPLVPVVVRMDTGQSRTNRGQVVDVTEITAVVAQAPPDLAQLVAASRPELTAGGDDEGRAVLLERWEVALDRADRAAELGTTEPRDQIDALVARLGRPLSSLTVDQLEQTVLAVEAFLDTAG